VSDLGNEMLCVLWEVRTYS